MIANYDRTSRLRAIAINAVREARIAIGRDHLPWIDDDAARADVIFQTLFLTEQEAVDDTMEHFPLVPSNQPPIDSKVHKIADLLGNLDEDIQEPPVAVKLPAKKA